MRVLALILLCVPALRARAPAPSDSAGAYAHILYLGFSPFRGYTYSFYDDEPGKTLTSPFKRGYYAYTFSEEFELYSEERNLMRQAENLNVFGVQALLYPALGLFVLAHANETSAGTLFKEELNGRLYVISAVLAGAIVPTGITSAVLLHKAVRTRNRRVVVRE